MPRVAFALGVTHALLYQKEMERADRIPDKEAREAKKKEIDRDYRQPALQLIEEGRSAVESPDFIEALIAFLDKRYDLALQKTNTAFQRQPWFFEAKKLEADILRTLGNEKRNSGDTNGAIDYYKKAEAAYKEAVQEGASFALGFGSLCALGHDWTQLMMYQTGFPNEEILRKSVDACNRSLQINPDRPEAYIAKSALMGSWGSYEMGRGLDPTDHFNESIEAGRSALKWDWVRFAAYTNMGVAYSRRAAYEMEHGNPAGESLDQAIECNRQAVKLNPNAAPFRNNLGISLAIKAGYELQNQRDANALQDEAIKEFLEAVRIHPTFEYAYNSLGEIHFEKARTLFYQDGNPKALLEQSVKYLKKTIEINPTFIPAFNTLSASLLLESLHRMQMGEDPSASLSQSVNSADKSIALNPQNADARITRAGAYCMQASYRLAREEDPSADLSQAEKSIREAEEIAAGHPGLPRAKAEVDLVYARWKNDPRRIQAGLASIHRALQVHPHDPPLHEIKCDLLLLQKNPAPGNDLRDALQQAMQLSPRLARKYQEHVAKL